MEDTSLPGKVQVSQQMRDRISKARQADHIALPFDILPRGHVSVKGKGKVKSFWISQMGVTNLVDHPAFEHKRTCIAKDFRSKSASWDEPQRPRGEYRSGMSANRRGNDIGGQNGADWRPFSYSVGSRGWNSSVGPFYAEVSSSATLSPEGPRGDLPLNQQRRRGSSEPGSAIFHLSSLAEEMREDKVPTVEIERTRCEGFAQPAPMELTKSVLGAPAQAEIKTDPGRPAHDLSAPWGNRACARGIANQAMELNSVAVELNDLPPRDDPRFEGGDEREEGGVRTSR